MSINVMEKVCLFLSLFIGIQFTLAQNQEKNKIIIFSTPWCKTCTRLYQDVWNHPSMEAWLSKNKFIFRKINIQNINNSKENKIFKKNLISKVPTVLVYSRNCLIHKFHGYQPLKLVLLELDRSLKEAKNCTNS